MYNNSENYSNETTIKNSKIIITFYLQNQAMVNKKIVLLLYHVQEGNVFFRKWFPEIGHHGTTGFKQALGYDAF